MLKIYGLPIVVYFAFASLGLAKSECIGPVGAKAHAVYLHGFEDPDKRSAEEKENRQVLAKLSKELDLKIALVEGPLCAKKRLCWPAKTQDEVRQTFALIKQARKSCFGEDKDYTLIGFSNGGYFAFKLYKVHKDPALKTIIASSSSGLWDPSRETVNPLSRFHLIIGDRDITRKDAEAFMKKFRASEPNASLTVFKGGHRIDFDSLKTLLSKAR